MEGGAEVWKRLKGDTEVLVIKDVYGNRGWRKIMRVQW